MCIAWLEQTVRQAGPETQTDAEAEPGAQPRSYSRQQCSLRMCCSERGHYHKPNDKERRQLIAGKTTTFCFLSQLDSRGWGCPLLMWERSESEP